MDLNLQTQDLQAGTLLQQLSCLTVSSSMIPGYMSVSATPPFFPAMKKDIDKQRTGHDNFGPRKKSRNIFIEYKG